MNFQNTIVNVVNYLTMTSETKNNFQQLRQEMRDYFDLEELKELCFDLEIDYEELGEGGKSSKIDELLFLLCRKRY